MITDEQYGTIREAVCNFARAYPHLIPEDRWEDYLHNVVIRHLHSRRDWPSPNPTGYFIRGIIHESLKDRKRSMVNLTVDPEVEGPKDTLSYDEEIVEKVLQRMDSRAREFLLLIDVAGLSYQQAGDLLGVPTTTISIRIHRARKDFRNRYNLLQGPED